MTVRVHLFARARDLAGVDAIDVSLPAGATVADVRRTLIEVQPRLRELLGRCAITVNEDFAEDEVILNDANEIAVIPPVSGGSR